MTNISFEVKSQLAKLLATENIHMQHSPWAMTAYFDIKNRVLTLPMWQNISEDLYDMLVVHEVGHALDTPNDKWLPAITDIAIKYHDTKSNEAAMSAIKDFLNVIEDARIDRRQKIRYPGSKRNYIVGYKELYQRDFFGIQNKDINGLSFIDRANIYFKNGTNFGIKFTPEEKSLIKKIESTETFDDVVKLTDEIYGIYSTKSVEEMKSMTFVMSSNDDNDDTEDMEEMDIDGFMPSDDDEYDNDSASSDEDDDKNSNSDKEENKKSSSSKKDDKDENPENKDDKPVASKSPEGGKTNNIPKSLTEEAARESLKSIVIQSNMKYIHIDLPDYDITTIVDDYKKVMEDMHKDLTQRDLYNSDYAKKLTQNYQTWRQKENDTISFMVKEFEMRKSADTYARQSISKTGVIDTNKLYSYKYNDDIFRRLTVVPKGKNHGFVMFVDWSGSMSHNIHNTLKQLFTLAMFCNRVHIPFEVYIFRTIMIEDTYSIKGKKQFIKVPNKENLDFQNFKLRNILSSRMTTTEMNKAFITLWKIGALNGTVNSDNMNSTPLNQSIMVADKIVNAFQHKYKLQIVNTVFLTDGASDPVNLSNANGNYLVYDKKNSLIIIRDPITRKTYTQKNAGGYAMTTMFLKILKDRTNCNLIGFFIASSLKGHGYMFDETVLNSKSVKDSWSKYNFAGITTAGYDEYYVIKLNDDRRPNILNVDPTMKPNAIKKAFSTFSEKKSINRMMIKSLMDRVAKDSVLV